VVEKANPSSFRYVLFKRLVSGEDGNGEVLCHDLETNATPQASHDSNCELPIEGEEEISEDGSSSLTIVELETLDTILDVLSVEDPQVSTAILLEKVIPLVEFVGCKIFKSTLVSRLNFNLFLSTDTLIIITHLVGF